jgi:hypothetical protein
MSGETQTNSAHRRPAWWLVALGCIVLLGMLMGSSAPSFAANDPWTITQLTNDRWEETGVVADGSRAAWMEERGAGENARVVIRDLQTGATTQVDAVGTNQNYALGLSGDVLVWQVSGDAGHVIYSYDISDATTTVVADTGTSDAKPVLKDGLIAWSASDGHDLEIYVYAVATREIRQVTNNEYDDVHPVISGRRIAWIGKTPVPGSTIQPDGTEGQVFAFNVDDSGLIQIGREGLDEQEVAIDGARLLFSGFSGTSYNLFLYSIIDATTTRLTNDPGLEERFKLTEDYAVWLGPGSAPLRSLYLYSFASKSAVKLSENATVDAPPDCDGTTVAWQGRQNGSWEVFAYDIASTSTSWLLNLGGSNTAPVISGYRVLWIGSDGHDKEVFSAAPSSVSPAPMFSDVSGMAPYRSAIVDLGGREVIGGYPDGTFRPSARLWRAQFAKMIVGALGVQVDASMVAPFSDLGPDDTASLYPHQYVAAAYFAGIIKGTSPNTFAPYTDITRAQVVTMIVRAMDSLHPGVLVEPPASEPGPLGPFDDVHAPNWRMAWYNGLLAGLVGYGPGSDPFAAANRGEVAQMLWNCLGLMD